jgi:DNA-binding response OmpR family regulator
MKVTKKILIVEDEKVLSDLVENEFDSMGFDARVAGDGELAMRLARSFDPDVIMLDLILPKKGGLDVLKELKIDPALKTIPVIVLSNLSGDESVRMAMTFGADDYFVKTQSSIFEIIGKVQKRLEK